MSLTRDFSYDAWPSYPQGQGWVNGTRPPAAPFDLDYHVDLGCGTVPKARIGVDRFAAPGVDVVLDFEDGWLPFNDDSIESVITHHAMEHVRNLTALVDEVYRVLVPGGIFFPIVPLFPSTAAVEDPDHCRYFMAYPCPNGEDHCSWDAYCGTDRHHTYESFSVPYMQARFERVFMEFTPRGSIEPWSHEDHRELRVALKK